MPVWFQRKQTIANRYQAAQAKGQRSLPRSAHSETKALMRYVLSSPA